MADDIVIVGAARTPVGSFNGAFANLPAHELGKVAIKAALKRAGVEGKRVSEVILGQILTAGQGQNPARQAAINAGIPVRKPGLGRQPALRLGPARGGARLQQIAERRFRDRGRRRPGVDEPGAARAHLRDGVKMGDFEIVDTMIKDGLWDAFNGYHMGNTAENVARQWQITREQQDEFAVASQNKAEAAQKAGRFKDEIVAGHHQDAARAMWWSTRTSIRATARRSKPWASCAPPSPRTARSPPATPRASTTAPPRWC